MVRYQILDRLLADRNHDYSLDDLTEIVADELVEIDPESDGVTRRTIEKDIQFLETVNTPPADIKRYTLHVYSREKQKTVRKHCLKYADPGFSIFNQDMSDEERELLAGALTLLGHFDGLPQFEQLENLRLKVRLRQRKSKVISLTKNPVEKSNILGQLFNTIINKQVIRLNYHRFKEDHDRVFILSPYLLKEFNRRWYLIGKDYEDETIRNLALDRIVSVEQLPAYKYEIPRGDVNERYNDVIGITYIADEPLQHIVFWVSDESDDYVQTKPLHHSQKCLSESTERRLRKKHPALKGGTFFSIDCKKNYELIRELISFGPELLIISPEGLQQEVANRIVKMVERYKNL